MRNLSLFTGSGIGDYAAKQAGITTVAQCENDPACQFALRKLWPECYLFGNVKDVSAKSLWERGLWPIDIISGGFPCTDISTAGRGTGIEGSRSGLWREMFRVIRQVRPAWLVVENVSVIRVRGVDRVLAPLERIGYTCWPLVVGSWSVGAPHKRDRVWIVARRMDDADETRRTTWDANGETSKRSEALGAMSTVRREGTLANTGRFGVSGGRVARDLACQAGATETDGEQRERLRDSAGDGGATGELGNAPSDEQVSRWPSRPDEPQHAWEAPRLIEFGVGAEPNGLAGRILASLGSGGNGIPPHKAASRANKSLLKIIGNGWQFEIPAMIYRWIVEQNAALRDPE